MNLCQIRSKLLLAVSEMADGKVAPGHLLAVSGQLILVSLPLLVVNLALESALLALGDADESVDDADEEDSATHAASNDVFSGIGQAGPFLLGLLLRRKLVQCFVDRGFAPDRFVSTL